MATILILAEVALVLVLGVGGLLWLYLRARRNGKTLSRQVEQNQQSRDAYKRYIKSQQESVVGRYRELCGDRLAPLHNSHALRGSAPPEQVGLQVRYEYLRYENDGITADEEKPGRTWETRKELAAELIKQIRQAEHVLHQWEKKAAQERADASKPSANEGENSEVHQLRRKLQRRESRLRKAESRVKELEAYKERFNTLHGHVVDEAGASKDLREKLRHEGTTYNRVQELLSSYEGSRAGLDAFMERGDIRPFASRHQTQEIVPRASHRLRRTRQLVDRTQEVFDEQREALRQSIKQQEAVIRSLQEKLEEASEKEEALKSYYGAEIKKLNETLKQSKYAIETLERENYRHKRTIDDLMAKLENEDDTQQDTEALEQTIDQFSQQALDMQQKIRALEQDIAELSGENIELKDRLADAGLNPNVASNDGATTEDRSTAADDRSESEFDEDWPEDLEDPQDSVDELLAEEHGKDTDDHQEEERDESSTEDEQHGDEDESEAAEDFADRILDEQASKSQRQGISE